MQLDDDIESRTNVMLIVVSDLSVYCTDAPLHSNYMYTNYECISPCLRLVFIYNKEPKINRMCRLYYTIYLNDMKKERVSCVGF